MDCRRDVLVLGWRGYFPSSCGFRIQSVTLEALRGAVARARGTGGAVLVVGEGVLEGTTPQAVLSMARWPWCVAVMVPGHASMSAVLRWRDAGVREVVEERDLVPRLQVLVELPYRGEVPMDAWAPRVHGDAREAERLLRMVPYLLELTVHAWAVEAGRSERSFRSDFRALFAAHPRDVLWDFVDASCRAGRQEGRPIGDLARALGFFDEANLRRAFRRRGQRFPGSGNRPVPRHLSLAEKDNGLPKRTLAEGMRRGIASG